MAENKLLKKARGREGVLCKIDSFEFFFIMLCYSLVKNTPGVLL